MSTRRERREARQMLQRTAELAVQAPAAAQEQGGFDSAPASPQHGQCSTEQLAQAAVTAHGEDERDSAPADSDAATTDSSQPPASELGRYSHRLVVLYDGTDYSGWQVQLKGGPGVRTIQGEVERALSQVLREDRRVLGVCGAGRTDAGVHARGQVVQFYTNQEELRANKLPYRLNAVLPIDVRVAYATRTAPDFNVTVSAIAKTYHYYIHTLPCHDPVTYRYRMHMPYPLDLAAIRAAARALTGTHDFTQFSNNNLDRLKRNPVRTIKRFDVVEVDHGLKLEVCGTGFLYKQVRHMAGVLVAVGQGRMSLEEVQRRLDIGSSQLPGAGGVWRGYNTAPAKGLFLHQVDYPAGVDDPNTLLYPEYSHDQYGRLNYWLPDADETMQQPPTMGNGASAPVDSFR